MSGIGFTGTQDGMTYAQKAALTRELVSLRGNFHHGDCIGADAEAHAIVTALGTFKRIGHPPTDARKRAFCDFDSVRRAKPYLARNHDIVDETDWLIVCPKGPEVVRSGTWATKRYAASLGKRYTIIWPNGDVDEYA